MHRSALLRLAWPGVALLFAVACSGASAAVGRVEGSCDKYGQCSDTLIYVAAPGERLDVRLTQTPEAVTIADSSATASAGNGCVATGPHELRCSSTTGSENDLQRLVVQGGDRGNAMDTSAVTGLEVELHGASGPDRMQGGASATGFFPGRGVTTVVGGSGGGYVSFAGRRTGLYVNLSQHLARGPGGLLVHISGVENVTGGNGDETLIGDGQANQLCGGTGRNVIRGMGGNDVLGSFGPAQLFAGQGHTILGGCGLTQSGPANREPLAFVCADAADEVQLDGLSFPTRAAWTIGSRCTKVSGAGTLDLSEPMRLLLNAANPARDYISMPFDSFYWPHRFSATLTARGGTLLGSLHLRTATRVSGATLRLSPTGVRYLRRHRPLTAVLHLDEQQCAHQFGCNATEDHLSLQFA